MNYWSKRDELRKKAQEHTEKMEKTLSREIAEAVKNSIIYDNSKVTPHKKEGEPEIQIVKADSVSALFQKTSGRVCVLNFASYKNPGGKFIDGSSAQEESLCHASDLYNILSRQTAYYEWNQQHLNRALYKNRAIYTPDVRFFQGRWTRLASVLTCAAPNRSCLKYGRFTEGENDIVLKSRIDFIADILAEHQGELDAVILGAFGCGVFQQDAEMVAKDFQESPIPATMKVVYAIPDGRNYSLFAKVFG